MEELTYLRKLTWDPFYRSRFMGTLDMAKILADSMDHRTFYMSPRLSCSIKYLLVISLRYVTLH